jgi:integrase
MVIFSLAGKRKRLWRSDLSEARVLAEEKLNQISNGDSVALTLKETDRLSYLRSREVLSPFGIQIDTACREYADALQILNGKASVVEACRDFVKLHATELPRITVPDAVLKLKEQARTDCKSSARQKQLAGVLDRFAENVTAEVHTLAPKLISAYLAALPLSERSKRNHRDVLRFFSKWLVLHGYLPKGTDLLEGVQKYSARKIGQISTWTPDEMRRLLYKAEKQMKKLVPFLAIAGFAELRHSEIKRLDWQQVDISDRAGESFIEVLPIEGSKSDQRRRLVPIKDNLKAWLLPYRENAGKVCPFENVTKQLSKLAALCGIQWKKNALRHSGISCRVAETGNVPLVAEEAGNSAGVIRTNYLRRLKPSVAVEWYSITPPPKKAKRRE